MMDERADASGKADATPIEHAPRRRGKQVKWTKETRDAFLDRLAETCSARAAAADLGLSMSSPYALLRRRPRFRDAWDHALEAGYRSLETRLVARALGIVPDQNEPGSMDVSLALTMLTRHRGATPHPSRRRRASKEDVVERIMAKLASKQTEPSDEQARASGE